VAGAAAGTVPVAQRGGTELELTRRSGRGSVTALMWDCSKSLPICSLPPPGSQDACERARARGTAQQGHGCRAAAAALLRASVQLMLSSILRTQTLLQPPSTPGVERDLPGAVLQKAASWALLGVAGSLVMSPQPRAPLGLLRSPGLRTNRQPGCLPGWVAGRWTAPLGKHLDQRV